MSYAGKWKGVAEPRASGAGYIYTEATGNKAKTTFTGRAVLYVATKMKTGGHVKLFVDGHMVGRYNLHAKTTIFGKMIESSPGPRTASTASRIVNDDTGKKATFDTFLIMK